jgi:2-octaprenylphenol hydroxylase
MLKTENTMQTHDIIIIGGGMVGMALACMLAKRTSLSILVLEAKQHSSSSRVSAIALSSQKIFQSLQVWSDIRDKGVSPFRKIIAWDAAEKGEIVFDSHEMAESLLGYIIENNVIQTSLENKARQSAQIDIISPVLLTDVIVHEDAVECIADDGRIFKAKLAVAADGANSWLRKKAGIDIEKLDYHQHAMVTTVRTALPHDETARQIFLGTGPLAFLPLSERHTSSIVWSLPDEEATRLMNLSAEDFQQALASAFEYRLGDVVAVEQRYLFPLSRQKTSRYIKDRVVLVGDAAHTVHPLAGQGVNMGLLDAASLVDVIADAILHHRDFSGKSVLRAYERWRKADNLMMFTGVDVIKALFASDKKPVQHMRSWGLNRVNSIRCLKNIFVAHAVGVRDGLPSLAK